MSTFVFSDTHFTTRFSQRKFNKLKSLILAHDTVIINGDFWEGLAIKFDDFLNSEWKQLFPLLKSKNTIYIYGNHDSHHLSDNRVYRFCNKAVSGYELKTKNQNFYFTHGEKFLYPHVKPGEHKHARSLYKKFDIYLGSTIQLFMITILGAMAMPKRFNKMTLETRKSITSMDNLLVCGHSHTPDYNEKMNFMDIGYFNYGWANYLTIENDGSYKFHSEPY